MNKKKNPQRFDSECTENKDSAFKMCRSCVWHRMLNKLVAGNCILETEQKKTTSVVTTKDGHRHQVSKRPRRHVGPSTWTNKCPNKLYKGTIPQSGFMRMSSHTSFIFSLSLSLFFTRCSGAPLFLAFFGSILRFKAQFPQ